MSNTRKVFFILNLLGLSFLFIAVLFLKTSREEKTGVLQVKSPSAARAHVPLTIDKSAETFYAILIMPKSYLPLLEQFSQQRIARKITILPAEFQKNAGKIVAVSKNTTTGRFDRSSKHVKFSTNGNQLRTTAETPAQKDKIIQKAALLFLLAGVEKKARHKY